MSQQQEFIGEGPSRAEAEQNAAAKALDEGKSDAKVFMGEMINGLNLLYVSTCLSLPPCQSGSPVQPHAFIHNATSSVPLCCFICFAAVHCEFHATHNLAFIRLPACMDS